jgi:hypothetical protein
MKQYKRVGWAVKSGLFNIPYMAQAGYTRKEAVEQFNRVYGATGVGYLDVYKQDRKEKQLKIIPLYADTDDLKGKKK